MAPPRCLALLLALARAAVPATIRQLARTTAAVPVQEAALPSSANCTERWIEQPLDHFSWPGNDIDTFKQRFLTYDGHWSGKRGAPIFFYVGNEGDVSLYANSTGLMWENAADFGAYIVFAEHRYYGKSLPTGNSSKKMFLTHEQALADYATLIDVLRGELSAWHSPVITFGGSYGGKLSAWMRMKYPAAVAGAISASAPLLAFADERPTWNSQSYYQIVTNTALHYSKACAENVHASMKVFGGLGASDAGRQQLKQHLGLCDVADATTLRLWTRESFDILAMGNYPWPSTYIAGTLSHPMPAYPYREACSHLSDADVAKEPLALLDALRGAVSVLRNLTGETPCFALDTYPRPETPGQPMDGQWDWQWCTERMPDSYWFSTDGDLKNGGDMFWPNAYNETLVEEHCRLAWGVTGRKDFISRQYGGRRLGAGHSNIVFTSGSFDGWASAGVATNISDSLISLLIEGGAHHLDLMFSHPSDPPSVKAARQTQLANIRGWVDNFAKEQDVSAASWGDNLGVRHHEFEV